MQGNKEYKPVSIGGWIGTILLSSLPGVNLILWIVWACIAKRPSRRNFSIALLILTGVFVLLAAVAVSIYGAELLEWARSLNPKLFTEALG